MEPLADYLLRYQQHPNDLTDLFRKGYLEQIKKRVLQAHRFVFDERASDTLIALITECPAEIIHNLDLCRPPYDSIWMETHAKPNHWFDEVQERDGFLIDGEMVHGVTSVRGTRILYPAWERYHLQTDWPRAEQAAFFSHYNISDWKQWVLGKLCDMPAWQALTDDECRLLLDRVRIDLFGICQEGDEHLHDAIHNIVLAGSMLPPLGCLLLLNHPKVVRQVPVPHYRRFMGGKSRQVREHTEITVDLSSQEIVRYITDQRRNSEAARRRRHEVRGHFAHDYVAREATCVHAWVRDDARRWHCANCMGRRWWKVEHERGDETLGRITKPYFVTSHSR